MNLWFNLNINDEPINNINYVNSKEFSLSDEDLNIIRSVLEMLTKDLAASDEY
jgi:hypothetical protein